MHELPIAVAAHTGSPWTLVLTAAAIMGSPGPVTVSLTAAGSSYGVRRSVGYLLGIIAGTMLVLAAVGTGITATLLALPGLRSVLLGVSAAYLVWLAYRIATAAPPGDRDEGITAPSLRGGALLGVANPKAWVAIAAVYASAHLAAAAAADAALKLAVLSGMIVLISSTWLLIGASLAPLFRDPRRGRGVNVALAAALLAATALTVVE